MDRALQRFLTIALLLICGLSYGQEKKVWITTDTIADKMEVKVVKTVHMTPATFAYYYQADKNLQAIEDSIPSLAAGIEEERAKSDSLEANLENQVEISNLKNQVLKESFDDCVETAVELEVHGMKLEEDLGKEKKKRKWFFGGGAGAGILLMILIL